MVQHTLLFSFDNAPPRGDLDRFLHEVEDLMTGPGQAHWFAAKPNVPSPGDANTPVLIADAIATMTFADTDALALASDLPDLGAFIVRWQKAHPYKVFAINHEELAH